MHYLYNELYFNQPWDVGSSRNDFTPAQVNLAGSDEIVSLTEIVFIVLKQEKERTKCAKALPRLPAALASVPLLPLSGRQEDGPGRAMMKMNESPKS